MNEKWSPIPNYETLYEASDMGRIRNVKRGTILKPHVAKTRGYLVVKLSDNGNTKQFFVHRLVYAAFNGEIPAGLQVNHIDEDKTNNRLSNLNLMTNKENNNWGTANKRRSETEKNRKDLSKIILQYDLQGNFIQEFPSIIEAERFCNIFNAHSSSIRHCLYGKCKTAYGYAWCYKK